MAVGETHERQQGWLSHICVGMFLCDMRLSARKRVSQDMGFVRSLSTFATAAVLAVGAVGLSAQTAPPLPPAGWVPNFGDVISSNASQTSFTFDRNMLSAADQFFANSDPETRRVVAGLNSITVRTFHAKDFARYDPGALGMIDAQYRAAGWKHLVNANGAASVNMTDMWLHFQGTNITGVTVLTRGDRNMSVVSVDCTLRPLDLLHLSGHFGIPKVDENAVMVPAH